VCFAPFYDNTFVVDDMFLRDLGISVTGPAAGTRLEDCVQIHRDGVPGEIQVRAEYHGLVATVMLP
jgi:hypothetical protein